MTVAIDGSTPLGFRPPAGLVDTKQDEEPDDDEEEKEEVCQKKKKKNNTAVSGA